jgi:NAD(P)H-hydrate epimerase
MRAADAATFKAHGIASLAVMESAGRAVGSYLLAECAELLSAPVMIVCGSGNNGGDGFVVARMLHCLGVSVELLSLSPIEDLKGDAAANARSYVSVGGSIVVLDENCWEEILAEELSLRPGIVVDAIYGTGFRTPMKGVARGVVETLNTFAQTNRCLMLSVDIPSGLEADLSVVEGPVLCADVTLALQSLKHAHVHYPSTSYCGEINVLDIGVLVDRSVLSEPRSTLLLEDHVAEILSAEAILSPEAHKGSRGHVFVIGGSAGRFGAPRMSASAALTLGAGKVTMLLPKSAAVQLAPRLNELMCEALPDVDGHFSDVMADELRGVIAGADALVVGPGMGTGSGARDVLSAVLQFEGCSKVIDADALTILSEDEKLWSDIDERVVLTPHPGEMARLLSLSTAEIQADRRSAAVSLSTKRGCWVLLKGARSILSSPDGSQYVAPAAIRTLGTAGSGDVLAGMIAGFLAQGFSVEHSSIIASFSHGAAGELAFNSSAGAFGTKAGDLARFAARVCNELMDLPPLAAHTSRRVLPGSIHYLPLELFDRP